MEGSRTTRQRADSEARGRARRSKHDSERRRAELFGRSDDCAALSLSGPGGGAGAAGGRWLRRPHAPPPVFALLWLCARCLPPCLPLPAHS